MPTGISFERKLFSVASTPIKLDKAKRESCYYELSKLGSPRSICRYNTCPLNLRFKKRTIVLLTNEWVCGVTNDNGDSFRCQVDLAGPIGSRVNVRLDRHRGGQDHAQETVYA
jgi:hypothetical protein